MHYLARWTVGRWPGPPGTVAVGLFASAQVLLHLLAVNLAMARLQLNARLLLAESLEFYLAVSGVFLFWYWFFMRP